MMFYESLLPKERIQCSLRRVRGPWTRHHARCRRSCRSGCKRGWPSSTMRRGKLVKPFRCWKGVDACREATTSTTYSNWMRLIQCTSDFLLYPFPAGFSLSSNLPFPSRYPLSFCAFCLPIGCLNAAASWIEFPCVPCFFPLARVLSQATGGTNQIQIATGLIEGFTFSGKSFTFMCSHQCWHLHGKPQQKPQSGQSWKEQFYRRRTNRAVDCKLGHSCYMLL